MPRLNSCPIDNGQLEFYGISRKGTGKNDPDTGEPIFERFRWQQCTTCNMYTREAFHGAILSMHKLEPDKNWFKVPRDE